jgi:hypothetical protein
VRIEAAQQEAPLGPPPVDAVVGVCLSCGSPLDERRDRRSLRCSECAAAGTPLDSVLVQRWQALGAPL